MASSFALVADWENMVIKFDLSSFSAVLLSKIIKNSSAFY